MVVLEMKRWVLFVLRGHSHDLFFHKWLIMVTTRWRLISFHSKFITAKSWEFLNWRTCVVWVPVPLKHRFQLGSQIEIFRFYVAAAVIGTIVGFNSRLENESYSARVDEVIRRPVGGPDESRVVGHHVLVVVHPCERNGGLVGVKCGDLKQTEVILKQ